MKSMKSRTKSNHRSRKRHQDQQDFRLCLTYKKQFSETESMIKTQTVNLIPEMDPTFSMLMKTGTDKRKFTGDTRFP